MRSTHLIIFQLGTEYCFQKGTSKIMIEKYLNRNKAHTVYNTTYSIWLNGNWGFWSLLDTRKILDQDE